VQGKGLPLALGGSSHGSGAAAEALFVNLCMISAATAVPWIGVMNLLLSFALCLDMLANRRAFRWAAAFLAVATVVAASSGCSALDERQRRWIFQPSSSASASWRDASSLDGPEDVWVDFESKVTAHPARLHGVWLPAAKAGAPLMLYLHGARRDVFGSLSRIRRMQSPGFSVLAIDYRGFGRSGDDLPSEETAAEDARAAWDWLAQAHPAVPRYIFGHSLGGAVAVRLAAERADQPAGVIVEGTFTSIRDVVSSFKWGWLPLGPLITQPFDSRAQVGRIRAPLLVVHGSDDQVIPYALGRSLFDAATTPRKKWLLVEGGSHHNTNSIAQQQYRDALQELFGLAN
jgi:alpha-beta hydrolase superfamily lysophospholipase